MLLRIRNIPVYFILMIILVSPYKSSGKTLDQKVKETSLRMIGHEFLMSIGDSTSRVMPIVEENGRYRIQFEAEFAFDPDSMASVISRVADETGLAESYIVEVQECKSREIVYSFMVDEKDESNIIPCKGRALPESCYEVLVTLSDSDPKQNTSDLNSEDIERREEEGTVMKNYLMAFIPIIVLLVLFLYWKRNPKKTHSSDLIHIGDYLFDNNNLKLQYNDITIDLTGKEAELLNLLYENVNITVKKEEILHLVWGDEGGYEGRTLDVFISKLRKKLENDADIKIFNIRGVGYKLALS